jgi:iron complex outermembrane receptor protein
MRQKWILLLGIILIYCTTATAALADENKKGKEKEAVKVDEIVVTATRTEIETGAAPASTSVVTQGDIQKRGSRSVDEALNSVVGAYNGRNMKGGMMDPLSNSAITLRGIPRANKTLFMVDGIVLNDAYSGSQRSSLAIMPENIKRIEVVKGPFSSLYGGYAVGGVVNIMTRMPEKREFTLKTGFGSSWERGESLDDLTTVYLSGGDKIDDKLSFLLSYGYKGTNGYPTDLNVQSSQPPAGVSGYQETTDVQGNPRYLIGDRGDDTWWDDTVMVKASYDLTSKTKFNLSFTNFRFERDFGDPHTKLKDASGNPVWSYDSVSESSFLSLGGKMVMEERQYGASFETELGCFAIKGSFGYIDRPINYSVTPGYSGVTRSGGSGVYSETVSTSYNADLQFTTPLGSRHILTFGGAYRHGEAENKKFDLSDWRNDGSKNGMTFRAGGEDHTWAIFAQDGIRILENLTGYIGFRYDWWETYDGYTNSVGDPGYPKDYPTRSASAFSPKAALVYQPFESTTLRTSIGRSFRPPSVYELYSVWIYRGVTTMAGPNLEPEKTTSWDVGVEQRLWQGAKFGATYFQNYLEDLIYSQTVSSTLVQKTNVGKAESRGVELELEQRFDKDIRLFANYTYTDSEVTENEASPGIVGKKLVMVPEHMFNIGGDFTYGKFSGSLVGRYVSKRHRYDDNRDTKNNVYTSWDPYFVVDARIAYQVTSFAQVSLSVDNIFDEDYYSYYKAPGRSWFAELTLRF